MSQAPIQPSAAVKAALSWHEQATARRRTRFGIPLWRKLFVSLAALVYCAIGLTFLFVGDEARRQMHNALEAQARTTAAGLASSTGQSLLNRDERQLRAIASRLAGETTGARAFFFDLDREPLGLSPERKLDARWMLEPQSAARLIDTSEGQFLAVAVPAGIVEPDGFLLTGSVVVGIDTDPLLTWGERSSAMMSIAGALSILMVLPLAAIMVRSAAKPVKELVGQARQLIDKPDDRLMISTFGGVYGEIADAFNEVLVKLRNTESAGVADHKLLQTQIQELHDRISARGEQLEVANQRLSAEIAEKEDFVRAVSHDLNAPLRNIGGMVQMLMMKSRAGLSDEVVQRLERIKKNVDIETDLINELLELSRIKSKKQQLEPVDLESMVWDIRGMFENDLKTRGIELVVDTVLPKLWVEKPRVRQVFQNLVDNAIKYMGEGPVREIHVGCTDRGSEVEFFVRDTGSGIHEDEVDKVFYIFRRGRSETTQKVAGKGVGLASVKSIIETYSGKIWVKSRLGEGTTFFFTINGKYVPALSGMSEQDYQLMNESAELKQAA
jgi:signal transduction histidine kinase